MDWNDIKLKDYYEITKIVNQDDLSDVEKNQKLIEMLFNIENTDSLNLVDFYKYQGELTFLESEIPDVKIKEKYTINGNVYNFKGNIATLTTGQYLDYEQYVRIPNNLHLILSVFMIPNGKEYMTDYDINEVQNDILELSVVEVLSIMNFFQTALLVFIKTTTNYLNKNTNKMKTNKAEKERLGQLIQILNDMDHCLMF